MGIIRLLIYRNVEADKKHQYKGMMIATALATFLTGVTEPIEYMFMFVATPLYLVCCCSRCCLYLWLDLFTFVCTHSVSIEFLTRTPLAINAGLGMDIINFIWVTSVFLFTVIMYFIANFMIPEIQLCYSRT